jgi:hypothetical protein
MNSRAGALVADRLEHLDHGLVGAAVQRAPQREMPAEIAGEQVGLPTLPTVRTVEVEQFCSWSACRISSRSSALGAITGSTSYSSHGRAEHHAQEVAAYDRSLRGYMNGWPMLCLYE